MKRIICLCGLLLSVLSYAGDRTPLWPKGRIPDYRVEQIAAMADEAESKGFNAAKHAMPYIEWLPAPEASVRNGACMILISGGAYQRCGDMGYIRLWNDTFTKLGVQCVNLVYRTPRPEGLPIYQTAWEDGQRAVRLVRKEAAKRGIDPDRIGVIAMSAGSHLALLLAANSQTPAYSRVDAVDDIPCNVNWAVLNAPAYITNDSEYGTPATRQGYGTDVRLSAIFNFDSDTCPMSLHHGGNDPYSPNGSTLLYRRLRSMGIPAELHLYADMGHGAYGLDCAVEFMRQMGYLKAEGEDVMLMDRYADDGDRSEHIVSDVWPENGIPDFRPEQCIPYMEWHFPKELKTKAIQIIYSGGSYEVNGTDGFEVAPARRYLNSLGMTVVTLKYRTPRPRGLSKHTTAWQDLQRTIKTVRSKAAGFGLDPDSIGIMGSSAGGHLTLMGVTSSRHSAYLPQDDIDTLPCNVQWGIGIYPAYALTDGLEECNSGGGNGDDAVLAPEFSFDPDTAPMIFVHGDADGWASMNSVKTWEKMRSMGIQSDLHTLALRGHCFQEKAVPGTGSYSYLDKIADFLRRKGFLK